MIYPIPQRAPDNVQPPHRIGWHSHCTDLDGTIFRGHSTETSNRNVGKLGANVTVVSSEGARSQALHLTGLRIDLLCINSNLSEAMMARPLRIEFAGALYHVTARGNA